jgi:hypothetical protein
MLSYLVRLATTFEQQQGCRPNVLYLNQQHYQQLRQDLASIKGLGDLVHFLGMEIIIAGEITHPHVGHSGADWPRAVAW